MTSRENGAPQKNRNVVLKKVTKKLYGASRIPESVILYLFKVMYIFPHHGYYYKMLYKCIIFESLYLLTGYCNRLPIFNTSYYTISPRENILWCLAQAKCRRYEVRYPMGLKTSTTSARSVQIASNSVYR